MNFGGISTVSTGDLNGDGLFDLVVGKTNGHIAVSVNVGTKTEPKFGAPMELKGTAGTRRSPCRRVGMSTSALDRGNFFGYASLVKAAEDPGAQPVEGESCLKVGYVPSQNKILPAPTVFTPAFHGFDLKEPASAARPDDSDLWPGALFHAAPM